ncbi:MAG: HmuY family protein [Prevotella sp.]|nr:HmuY family protein [Prevotella sp.]
MSGALVKATMIISMIGMVSTLLSCDSIYDDMSEMPASGQTGNSYAYIDATDYTKWVYINLDNGEVTTLDYKDSLNIPEEWTFALHRYDCKTNGGSVMETTYTSLDDLQTAIHGGVFTEPEETEMVSDTRGQIIIDMSHMLDLYIIYDDDSLNTEMTKWLDVNISYMPPIYTPSNKVYLLRLNDGRYVAVRFTGFSNPYYYDTKGYISFDYLYPVEFQ